MTRPIHLGEPPSACERATATSAWTAHADRATCQLCTETWAPTVPHSRGVPEDNAARVLVAWRVARGLRQEDVAARLGVSRPTLINYERRGSRLRLDCIASLLDVDPGELLARLLPEAVVLDAPEPSPAPVVRRLPITRITTSVRPDVVIEEDEP